jgi:hypothetical protein
MRLLTAVETMVEGGLAAQGAIDLTTEYAKKNPDSKIGQLLNDHSKHTPKVGNHHQDINEKSVKVFFYIYRFLLLSVP